ncbi:hypothetical protein [Cellulomonas sp.]|uniref:hypothetical protein n=1 Tax=Cellulomonas sp. TaxID=40001 RepID=UPI001B2E6963|nr:hypothetical protein [Cellulomonas sp.]MBO9556703.1 hypothetical protein [Cellulomonas sp.]
MSEVSGPVDALYRQILRTGELSTPVDAGLVAELAMALTAGGALRELADCTDLASTGGPGSISTMLVPLMARASGVPVAKVGVPGRPAGAVDVLANVPGYRWSSTADEFDAAMRRSGFAHTAANEHWAPGDAALFRLRQAEGTQNVPALVVASLLAKKLAAGVRYPGFEVRAAPHGNFGSSRDEVRRHASLLCEVASRLGMRATVFVTDAEFPPQPWIGRGEALFALSIACLQYGGGTSRDVLGPEDPVIAAWLTEHVAYCEQITGVLVKASSQKVTRDAVEYPAAPVRSPESGCDITTALSEHLVAHGSTWGRFNERSRATIAGPRTILRAERGGFLRYRIERIRDCLVGGNSPVASSGGASEGAFPDRVGALLHVPVDMRVEPGDAVLSLRWPSELGSPDVSDLFEITAVPARSPSEAIGQLREVID